MTIGQSEVVKFSCRGNHDGNEFAPVLPPSDNLMRDLEKKRIEYSQAVLDVGLGSSLKRREIVWIGCD